MSKFPALIEVSSRYGAPMGRHTSRNTSTATNVTLHHLPLSQGYDAGGAYWGWGMPLYRAAWYDEAGESCEAFVRAGSRQQAANLLGLESEQLLRGFSK
jgi:hypothetical protein